MFSSNHSTRENEQFELVYVGDQKDVSILSCNHSVPDDVHLKHVAVKYEKVEHQAPSPNHSILKMDDFQPVIVKEEEHEGDEIFFGPEQWTEDPECEKDAKAVCGSDFGASGSSPSVFAVDLPKLHLPPSTDGIFVSTASQHDLDTTMPTSELKDKAAGPDLTVMEQHDFPRQTSQENKCEVEHVLTHDNNRFFPFACKFCEYRTDYKSHLKRHLLTHDYQREKPYACNHCNFRTDRKSDLKSHLLTHDSNREKPFACNLCTYKTCRKNILEKHFLTHDSNRDKPFACSHCRYRTDDKRNFKRHLITHDSNHDKQFAYNHCKYRTGTKPSFETTAATTAATQLQLHNCNNCSYTTDVKCNLKQHIFACHSEHLSHDISYDSNQDKPFVSIHCEYTTGHKPSLNKHILTHQRNHEKLFTCNDCSYKTIVKFNLKRHILAKHSEQN